MDYGESEKFSKCIVCANFTTKVQCYNIFTTSLNEGKVLLSNFLKNVLDCSVLIVVPPHFFVCKRCYSLCSELDCTLARCNDLQQEIQTLFKETKKRIQDTEIECVSIKEEIVEEDEFFYDESEELYEEPRQIHEETIEAIESFLETEVIINENNEIVVESSTFEKDDIDCSYLCEKEGVLILGTNELDYEYSPNTCLELMNQEVYEEVLPFTGEDIEEIQTSFVPETSNNEVTVIQADPLSNKENRLQKKNASGNESQDESFGGEWFCKSCDLNFSSLQSLQKHKKNKECKSKSKNLGIKSVVEFKDYTVRQKKKKKVFFCNSCSFETPIPANMEKHLKSHKDDPPFMCDTCGKRFKQLKTFTRHQQTHDRSVRPFGCSLCPYRSETESTLKIHERIHDDEKKYVCTKCNYKTTKRIQFQNHIRKHTGERPYCCPDCPYRSKDSSTLIRHRRIHGGLKRYECNVCDYKSVQKIALQRHMMIHTGEKPHMCPHCDYRSTQNHNLAAHIASKHSTEKPFACAECNYKTKVKRLLKNHMRSHSDEKPFACPHCDYRVRYRQSLRYHLLKKHGNNPKQVQTGPKEGQKRFIVVISKPSEFEGHNVEFSDEGDSESDDGAC